jgi:preprotein translocase subunit SecD
LHFINVILLFLIIKFTGATLTLAGIGGIIYRCMAVDANILNSQDERRTCNGSDIYSAMKRYSKGMAFY